MVYSATYTSPDLITVFVELAVGILVMIATFGGLIAIFLIYRFVKRTKGG